MGPSEVPSPGCATGVGGDGLWGSSDWPEAETKTRDLLVGLLTTTDILLELEFNTIGLLSKGITVKYRHNPSPQPSRNCMF